MHRLLALRPLLASSVLVLITITGCSDDKNIPPEPVGPPEPVCNKDVTIRIDAHSPQSMVADWSQPVRITSGLNTLCPQDAIEISADGQYLYVLYTEDLLDSMPPDRILARENNTYRLERTGGPGEFGEPEYYDLAKGTSGSLDGEVSFAGDSLVYFHSLRLDNTGFQQGTTDDILDMYVADLDNGVPGPGRNLGQPVNSEYLDGEHAIHPDGVSLYFASDRPGGHGQADLYVTQWDGSAWSAPVNLGDTINSLVRDYQVTFTADGDTMYFASERNLLIGVAIYRSHRNGGSWSMPELVIQGIVGEPSLTADGRLMYFVHVLSDSAGNFDADVWYSQRTR
ncbi:hypothetical protein GF377_08040 [candidate division GN15 bacterium]|nr:hypothetical protein [candidate division GN15 bacterium]